MVILFVVTIIAAIIVLLITAEIFLNPRVSVDWSKQIVLVTGGSQGLGLAFVKQLLHRFQPKHLVVLSLHEPPEGSYSNDKVSFYHCDVSEYKNVENVAGRVMSEIGIPTAVVNNAGIVVGKKFVDLTGAEIERVIKVNLLGTMYVSRVFLPYMLKENSGHILNVSSLLGMGGSSGVVDYCSSKFGVSGFTESLIQETKHTSVKVSVIYPGLLSTSLFTGVRYAFPVLTPEYVASKMVDIINRGKSVERVVPWVGNLGRAMKLVPVGLQGFAKDLIGANSSMDSFIPLDKRAESRTKSKGE